MTEPMPMPPPELKGEQETKRPKSKGEKFFDRAVYAGIAGVGTFIATVILADELKTGRMKWFHEGTTKFFKRTADFVARRRDNSNFAQDAAMTTSLMMGGNLMLIPVGIAEHHKVALVDGLNAAMEDKTPKEDIQKAPKQTWGSLAKSRGLAWLAVFGTLKGLSSIYGRTMESFNEQTGELACNIMNKPTHRGPMDVIEGLKTEVKQLKALAESTEVKEGIKDKLAQLEKFETRTYRYGKIGAIDVFATIGSATLLYLGGHFFARKHEEKIERRAEHKRITTDGSHLREEAQEISTSPASDMPGLQVAGSKQHEGTAVTPVLAQQL